MRAAASARLCGETQKNYQGLQLGLAAASARLCVETSKLAPPAVIEKCSRLRAAVC